MTHLGGFWRRLAAAVLLGSTALSAAGWTETDLQPLIARHTDAMNRLLDELDLGEVVEQQDNGSTASTLAALLTHYQTRQAPADSWLPGFTAEAVAVDRADAVLRDRFHLQGAIGRQPRRSDGGLDWEAKGPENDPEWAWILNRHAYFEYLLLAYQQTGDTLYIDRLSADLVDWITASPYPDRLTFSAAWRPLEVARRVLNSWTHVFFALQDEPAFTAEARLLLLSSIPQHADALANHYSFWGGNHLITETTALATIAVAWPEFAKSQPWLAAAIDRFHEQLMAQTYPDGAFKELTNHYQKIVWLGAERFSAILDATDQDEPVIEAELKECLTAMRRYFEGVMRPDGKGPLNNASDREDNAWQLAHAGIAPDFPTTLLEDGRESPALYFPWAGHAVMRDSWENGREWAFFDIGPFGSAHQHRDALHLSIWFDGITFLADSGRFTYQPGPWTNYFKGPEAHNIVLLDGSPPLPGPRTVTKPLENRITILEDRASFTGRAVYPPSGLRGSGPSIHERTVIHLPGTGWLIIDDVRVSGAHTIETIWNFGPTVAEAQSAAHLRLLFARDSRGPLMTSEEHRVRGETEPVGGWYSERFGEREPALTRHLTHRIRGRTQIVWTVPVDRDAEVSVTELNTSTLSVVFASVSAIDRVQLRFAPQGIDVTTPTAND